MSHPPEAINTVEIDLRGRRILRPGALSAFCSPILCCRFLFDTAFPLPEAAEKHGEIRALIFQTLYDDFSAHELYQLIRDGHTDSGVMYPDHEVHRFPVKSLFFFPVVLTVHRIPAPHLFSEKNQNFVFSLVFFQIVSELHCLTLSFHAIMGDGINFYFMREIIMKKNKEKVAGPLGSAAGPRGSDRVPHPYHAYGRICTDPGVCRTKQFTGILASRSWYLPYRITAVFHPIPQMDYDSLDAIGEVRPSCGLSGRPQIWNPITVMPVWDLDEMETAEVDTAHNNILVYAGELHPEWQDRGLSSDECTVLLLTDTGFVPVDTLSGGKHGGSPDFE